MKNLVQLIIFSCFFTNGWAAVKKNFILICKEVLHDITFTQ